jgi:tRNA (guanine37-N1)-methyltransferase
LALHLVLTERMTFRASCLTLFPEAFPGLLGVSILGNALSQGLWELETIDIRTFGLGKHRTVDDTPAGGGAGMVMRADVAAAALDSIDEAGRPRIYLSPRGQPLTQSRVRELAAGPGVILLCGRFEGLDQRVIEGRGLEEVSIGDFVLAGGEVAAHALIEACVRLLPGVAGNAQSIEEESFETGLLEHPHYTRPQTWEGREIPAILTSGDHAKVHKWRRNQAEELTKARRPDLYAASRGSASSGDPHPAPTTPRNRKT